MTAETPQKEFLEQNNPIADLIHDVQALDMKDVVRGDLSQLEHLLYALGIEWGARFIAAILILIIGWTIGSWAQRKFNNARRLDRTLKDFLGRCVKYLFLIISIVTVIGLFGIPMASLLAVLGAAGLAIGLALQGTLSNVASGVMLLILRPFNVGDFIEFGGESGTVKTLGLFGTELSKADNVYVFAPNSKIWGSEIRNYSRNMQRRQDISVGIDYNADIEKAFTILHKLVQEDARILQEPGKEPQIFANGLDDFTVGIVVRFWSANADYWNLRWDMNRKIQQELAAGGISLALTPRQMVVNSDNATSRTEQK